MEFFSEKEYITGFNSGYTIAGHLPEFASQLDQIETRSDFVDGLRDGMYERSLEIERLPRPEWLNPTRLDDINNERDFEKDKDFEKE